MHTTELEIFSSCARALCLKYGKGSVHEAANLQVPHFIWVALWILESVVKRSESIPMPNDDEEEDEIVPLYFSPDEEAMRALKYCFRKCTAYRMQEALKEAKGKLLHPFPSARGHMYLPYGGCQKLSRGLANAFFKLIQHATEKTVMRYSSLMKPGDMPSWLPPLDDAIKLKRTKAGSVYRPYHSDIGTSWLPDTNTPRSKAASTKRSCFSKSSYGRSTTEGQNVHTLQQPIVPDVSQQSFIQSQVYQHEQRQLPSTHTPSAIHSNRPPWPIIPPHYSSLSGQNEHILSHPDYFSGLGYGQSVQAPYVEQSGEFPFLTDEEVQEALRQLQFPTSLIGDDITNADTGKRQACCEPSSV